MSEVHCPNCQQQGFDGQGIVIVEGTRMFLRRCWNCDTRFATEDDDPVIP